LESHGREKIGRGADGENHGVTRRNTRKKHGQNAWERVRSNPNSGKENGCWGTKPTEKVGANSKGRLLIGWSFKEKREARYSRGKE